MKIKMNSSQHGASEKIERAGNHNNGMFIDFHWKLLTIKQQQQQQQK